MPQLFPDMLVKEWNSSTIKAALLLLEFKIKDPLKLKTKKSKYVL
jgi:hypothetical protein